jgi:glutathione S-transferase
MIILYELRWSHYCEKVRLALGYLGVPWRAVSINAFGKKELQAHPRPAHLPNATVPAIWDDSTQQFVMDSTPILRYLAETYASSDSSSNPDRNPDGCALFGHDAPTRAAIDAQLVEFDTHLGLPARRVGYSQVILECPAALSDLFLPEVAGGLLCAPGVRQVSGRVLGMLLAKRFDFHGAEAQGVFEALEAYLVALALRLERQEFVVVHGAGPASDAAPSSAPRSGFSMADLALAAMLRPLTIVPFFAEHPQLQSLFARQRSVLQRHSPEGDLLYQQAIAHARLRRAPVRRRFHASAVPVKLSPTPATVPLTVQRSTALAVNDQRNIWDAGMWAMPFHYFYTLRKGKVRQAFASAGVR